MLIFPVERLIQNHRECPLCGHHGSWTISFYDDEQKKTIRREHGYCWLLCARCGNGFPSIEPEFAQLQSYWNRNRIESGKQLISEAVWKERLDQAETWANRTYEFARPFIKSGMSRYLDVACGLGASVGLFQRLGWQSEGIDADPNTSVFHEKFGIKVTIGQIETLKTQLFFDIVSISHAIYFVKDPRQFIQRVRELLAEKGLFLVILSDLLSSLNIGRPGYAHTWYPTKESLVYVLEQEGFQIIQSKSLKGSILVLAQVDDKKIPIGHPLRSYIAHRTQWLRQFLIGRPRLLLARGVKGIRNLLS